MCLWDSKLSLSLAIVTIVSAAPALVRPHFNTFVDELYIAAYQSREWLNNFIHPLFAIEYNVKFLENMALHLASTRGRIVRWAGWRLGRKQTRAGCEAERGFWWHCLSLQTRCTEARKVLLYYIFGFLSLAGTLTLSQLDCPSSLLPLLGC